MLIKCKTCNEIKSYEEVEAHENICLEINFVKANENELPIEDSSFMKSFDKIDESRNIEDNYIDGKLQKKIQILLILILQKLILVHTIMILYQVRCLKN